MTQAEAGRGAADGVPAGHRSVGLGDRRGEAADPSIRGAAAIQFATAVTAQTFFVGGEGQELDASIRQVEAALAAAPLDDMNRIGLAAALANVVMMRYELRGDLADLLFCLDLLTDIRNRGAGRPAAARVGPGARPGPDRLGRRDGSRRRGGTTGTRSGLRAHGGSRTGRGRRYSAVWPPATRSAPSELARTATGEQPRRSPRCACPGCPLRPPTQARPERPPAPSCSWPAGPWANQACSGTPSRSSNASPMTRPGSTCVGSTSATTACCCWSSTAATRNRPCSTARSEP